MLFIFLTGGMLELARSGRLPCHGKWLILLCWMAVVAWAAWLLLTPAARAPYNLEVALGYAVGLPAVQLLHGLRQRVGSLIPGQQLAGILSYGIFLVHFPVIWLLELQRPALAQNALLVILLSLLVSLLVHHALERPLWRRLRMTLVTTPK